MDKINFFSLVIPILAFVLYLGGTAIMNGFSAKKANKPNEVVDENEENLDESESGSKQLSNELGRLNQLLEKGVLTKEEFEKAKKKILED